MKRGEGDALRCRSSDNVPLLRGIVDSRRFVHRRNAGEAYSASIDPLR